MTGAILAVIGCLVGLGIVVIILMLALIVDYCREKE